VRSTSYNSKNILDYAPQIIGLIIIYKIGNWFFKTNDIISSTSNGKPPLKKIESQSQRVDTDVKLDTLVQKLTVELNNINSNEENIVLWLKTIKSDADWSYLNNKFGYQRKPFSLSYLSLTEYLQNTLEPYDKASINANWSTKKALSARL